MSLTKCIRKAGKLLSDENRAAIFARHAGYLDAGEKSGSAARKALQEQLEAVRADMKAPPPEVPKAKVAEGGEGAEQLTPDQAAAQRIALEQPDLKVTLPGSDEQLTVADALARIAEEHKQEGQWADLVKVAVECALSGG